MKSAAIFGLVASALLLPVQAQEKADVMGIGSRTCAEFAQDYKNDVLIEMTFFIWAQGYMSGLNTASASKNGLTANLNSQSISTQKQKLREYCDAHPLNGYSLAATVLWADLSKIPSKKP